MIRPTFFPIAVVILVTACAARANNTAPRMLRLNQEPHVSAAGGLCRDPAQGYGPHVFAEEYFSILPPSDQPLARDSIAVGSIIIKEKYVDGHLSITTTMTKLDARQEETSWRYAMINAQGQDITETWRSKTGMECIDCHQKYQARDYVTPVFWNYYQAALSPRDDGSEKQSPPGESR